jgi:hypothetical protein
VRSVSRTDGVIARIIDEVKIVSSGIDSDTKHLTQRGLRAAAGCTIAGRDEVELRHEPLLGFMAIVFQATRPKAVRITEWRVPELGCFALRRTSETLQADGTYKIVSEYRPIRAQKGIFGKSIFEIPADYSEMKPSDLEKRMNEYFGIQLPAVPNHWSQLDKEYEQRKRQPVLQ